MQAGAARIVPPTKNAIYRFKADVYVPAGNTIKSARIWISCYTGYASSTILLYKTLPDDTWTRISGYFKALDPDDGGWIHIDYGTDPDDGDILYIDNISIREVFFSSPIVFDGGVYRDVLPDHEWVQLIQWVDSEGVVADNDDLVMNFNGRDITVKAQRASSPDIGAVIYQMGPFDDGVPVTDFKITTLDAGSVLLWVK